LYELVTGKMPFEADTLGALFLAVYQMAPTPLPQLRADLPPEFIGIVMRCLEKNPAHRFASVEELSQALAPYAPDERVSTVPGGTAPGTAPPAITGVNPTPPLPLQQANATPAPSLPMSARDQVSETAEAEGGSFGKVAGVTFAAIFVGGALLLFLYFRFAGSP